MSEQVPEQEDTTKQEQTILDHNPGTLSLKISDACRDGWRVDPDRPMTLLGFLWEVWLLRDATDEQVSKDAELAGKRTRAEILADARAAKAARKEEAAAQQTQEEKPKADATE